MHRGSSQGARKTPEEAVAGVRKTTWRRARSGVIRGSRCSSTVCTRHLRFPNKEICGNCAHLARSSATLGRPRPGSRCMTSWLGSCDWLTRPGSSEMAGNPAAIMVIRDAPPDSGNNGPGGSEQ
uniref:Uncharacterized protein n=1 Tax=Branchiostoma floridae TaxID=7739 RepID=C3YML2_BRAFL|eukprot:XP_002602341.1 hypothetical protein BRAFLDRAFT_128482 [Branchiostoma floridae]